jgi:hypothetical protein
MGQDREDRQGSPCRMTHNPDTPSTDPMYTESPDPERDPPSDPARYHLTKETLRKDQHFERMLLVKELAIAAIVIVLILLRCLFI